MLEDAVIAAWFLDASLVFYSFIILNFEKLKLIMLVLFEERLKLESCLDILFHHLNEVELVLNYNIVKL